MENYRPGVLAKMGFTSDFLEEINPMLICASVNGYGSTGPYVDRPSFDFIAQAMSGFMSVNGPADGDPMRAAPPMSDMIAGLYAAFGVVTALQARHRTGKGQNVESSLTNGLISMMAYLSAEYLATGSFGEGGHGLTRICASAAYARDATGDGIKVAVLDTGITVNGSNAVFHTELDANVATFTTNSDVIATDSVPNDEEGHGSHVAGIIAGENNGSGYHGVAYDATLYIFKVLKRKSKFKEEKLLSDFLVCCLCILLIEAG